MAATPAGRDAAAPRHLAPAPDLPPGADAGVTYAPADDDARVTLITDGDRYPGMHLVRRLAEHGMRVVLGCRSLESGRSAVARLGPLADRVAVRQLDPADPVSVERLSTWLHGRLRRCDVLIAGASEVAEEDGPAAGVDLDAVRRTVERNVLGPWRLVQAVAPLMRAGGYGRVVLLASGEPARATPHLAAHTVCRPAVIALVETLAIELAEDGILVNACWPGSRDDAAAGDPATLEEPVRLATLPADGPSGQLFTRHRPARRVRPRP